MVAPVIYHVICITKSMYVKVYHGMPHQISTPLKLSTIRRCDFLQRCFLIICLSASPHLGRIHYQRCELLVFPCLRYFQSYGLSTDGRHLQQLLHWIRRFVYSIF